MKSLKKSNGKYLTKIFDNKRFSVTQNDKKSTPKFL